ncbi:SH3 domain-containing protein [Phaeobacter sp. B1627]|uniref:SH3 domain-containing protein n=1 Tax=Phaeobacter sp. B1627 TaxID=2583809 RepID=UPI00111B3BF6|nr:SH3 domain-containing protein [Phaeobacter sp. B1627]TNJ41185.1 SH3 domain-containing protein [Phaeobacter sp. B1627]
MSRFLIVSFAGLALGFYELSGGADFTPPEPPVAAADLAEAREIAPLPRDRIIGTPVETTSATPVLTRYGSSPITGLTPTSAPQPTATAEVPTPAAIRVAQPQSPTSADTALLTFKANGLQIGALEGGLSAITAEPATTPIVNLATPEPKGDVRRIRASRANIRLGPSTQFPVMTQLLAGDQVRVLNEDPSGWALLENPRTGDVGWIAASLLSAKGS